MKRQILSLISNPVVSLDIGSHSIKLVEGKYKGNSFNIRRALTLPTPTEAIRDGRLLNIQGIKEAISAVIKEEDIKARDLVFTIESTAVITREILLPASKPQEIASMLEFELEQYLPVALEQYSIQKKRIEEFEENGVRKSNILVAALPKEIVNEYLSLCQQLSMTPMAMDLNANSIYKLLQLKGFFNDMGDFSNKTIAIIDIGHSFSNIVIVKYGVLKLNRLMPFGGKEIEFNIANSFNLTLEEAEDKKKSIRSLRDNLPEDNSTAGMLINILKENVDNWIRDIDRLFKYYLSRESGNKIDAIYLYGGSSRISGLAAYLRQEFQMPAYLLKDKIDAKYLNSLKGDVEDFLNPLGAIIRR